MMDRSKLLYKNDYIDGYCFGYIWGTLERAGIELPEYDLDGSPVDQLDAVMDQIDWRKKLKKDQKRLIEDSLHLISPDLLQSHTYVRQPYVLRRSWIPGYHDAQKGRKSKVMNISGSTLRSRRQALGLRPMDIALSIGIDMKTVTNCELGKETNIRKIVLYRRLLAWMEANAAKITQTKAGDVYHG